MSFVGSNILAGASGQGGGGFAIERSLRFNSGDSAYLNRTFSAGNRKTWTWSGWFKLSKLGQRNYIFTNWNSSGQLSLYLEWTNSDKIRIGEYSSSAWEWQLDSTSQFRDSSAWYHLVVAVDTTQSTASDRVKVYINGEQLTSFSPSNYPSQNKDTYVNQAVEHNIGRLQTTEADFYLADVHFIDGQALAPTDFGETDDNGVWQPKEFAGIYSTADTTDDIYAWKATTSNGGGGTGWYFTQEDNSSSIGLSGSTGGHPNELGGNTLGARTGNSSLGAYGTFATVNGASAGSSAISRNASFSQGSSALSFVYNKTVNRVWVHNGSSWVGGGNPTNTSSTGTFDVPSSGKVSFGIVQSANNEALTLEAIDSSVYSGTATGITFRGSYGAITLSSNNTVATCTSGSGGYKDAWSIELLNTGTGENSFHLDFKDNSSNAALGTDTSGNSNTWTVNNLSAAAAGLATANQGMDVVAYTGDGSTSRSISSLSFPA
jgi:hypothetical protein